MQKHPKIINVTIKKDMQETSNEEKSIKILQLEF